MAEVRSQPTINSGPRVETTSLEKDALISRLDELLEQYLQTLDEYQKTRERLSKQLSSGYLSLAQANFQNRSTTHYGQDSYDERMQAIRKINILSQGDSSITFSAVSETPEAKSESDEKPVEKDDDVPEPPKDKPDSSPDPKKKDGPSKASKKSTDPLRWFGILVPPALRSAQQSFILVAEGPVPQLASIARELRNQEIEIGRVRKQIKKM